MKERVTAAIRLEAPVEIGPPVNLVNGFVLDQAFEDERRGAPIDPLEDEEATVEPGLEEVQQV